MNTIDLEIHGMSCDACVRHVTKALKSINGVSEVTVDLPNGHARVNGMTGLQSAQLTAALDVAGYPARVAGTSVSPSDTNGPKPAAASGRRSGCCG